MPTKTKINSKQITEAFAQASRELGEFQIKGRGHAPRVNFSLSWVSSAAAKGTDNWEYIVPYKNAGAVRFFPFAVVRRVVEILGLQPEIENTEIPVYRTVDISTADAHDGNGTKHEGVYSTLEQGHVRYFACIEIIGYRSISQWQCPELGVSYAQDTGETKLDSPIPIENSVPSVKRILGCLECKFYSRNSHLRCSVRPDLFLDLSITDIAGICSDFERVGS